MSSNPVVDLIEEIYKARHQIAQAYDAGEVEITEENERIIEPLQKMLLVNHTASNKVRLLTDLTRLLDTALRKEGIIAINADLGMEVEAMDIEFTEYLEAERALNYDDSEKALSNIKSRLYAIYDRLNMSAIQLQSHVDLGFGLSNNLSSRSKENKYYLKEISKLVESFEKIRGVFAREGFQGSPIIRGYIHNIESKSLGVVDRIKQIQDLIRNNIFQQRVLEEKAVKIRALSKYIKERPSFYPGKAEDNAHQHSYFLKSQALAVLPYPDKDRNENRDILVSIIEDLQKRIKVETQKVQKEDSTLINSKSIAQQSVIPVCEKKAVIMLSQIHKNRAVKSAKQFYIEQFEEGLEEFISIDYWLYFLLNFIHPDALIRKRRILDFVTPYPVTKANPEFNGNKRLLDIVLASKNADKLAIRTAMAKENQ
tara:strand:- start:984 stop:2261 length:1278 start_codon:yes stop_codon:yes gene_type:complete